MGSLDAKTIVELMVNGLFLLAGLWLAAEKRDLQNATRTGLQNTRKDLDNVRAALELKVQVLEAQLAAEQKARESFEQRLNERIERAHDKMDAIEESAFTKREQSEFKKDLFERLGRLEAKIDKLVERK